MPRLRILYIERDEHVREPVCSAFEHAGHVVTAVESLDAAAAVLAQGTGLDVVIADVALPSADGHAAIECVRRQRARVPIVLTSAWTFGFSLPDVAAFVHKPYSPAQLLAATERVLPPAASVA